MNHIYPDETRRELIRSEDLDELRTYAKEKLDDWNLEQLFEEWKAYESIAPITERLSPSLEITVTD